MKCFKHKCGAFLCLAFYSLPLPELFWVYGALLGFGFEFGIDKLSERVGGTGGARRRFVD